MHVYFPESIKNVPVTNIGWLFRRLELGQKTRRTIERVFTTHNGLVQVVLATPAVSALQM